MSKIASLEKTLEITKKHKIHTSKKLGQNFLIDQNITRKIRDSLDLNSNTVIIEIGVGIGSLTQELVLSGKQVIAYEIDTSLKEAHKEYLNYPNLLINYEDILEVDLDNLIKKLKDKQQDVVVVGNLPYYITSKIINKIILLQHTPKQLVFMIQDEVANKFINEDTSPLTLTLDYIGSKKYLFKVNRNVYFPKPHVDSGIIEIKIDRAMDLDLYKLIKICFIQKRKTVLNNLKTYPNIKEILNSLDFNQKRAQQLTIQDYQKLKEALDNENKSLC